MKKLFFLLLIYFMCMGCKYTHTKTEEHHYPIGGDEITLRSKTTELNGEKTHEKILLFNGDEVKLSKDNVIFANGEVLIKISPSEIIAIDNQNGFFDEFK